MSEGTASRHTRKPAYFDQLILDLRVEEKAQDDAGNSIPTSEAVDPTLHERELIEYFRGLAREEKDNTNDDLDSYKAKMSEIYHSRIVEELNGLPEELTRLNHESKYKDEQEFIKLRCEARSRHTTMKKFAMANKLNRDPQPQDNPMQMAFWITAIVLLETSLNATFFAVGSDRGLLGGAIQAFVISFLNVMGAWFFGRLCLPQLNHCQPDRKYIGAGFAILLVVGIFMLNMFAGHYRSALEEDAFKAVLMAVESFKDGILSIKSAQGWLLTAVGSVAFTGLATKIYFSDDPYPGYGRIYREYLRAKDIWLQRQREFTEIIIANYTATENTRGNSTDQLTKLEVGYGVLLDKVRRVVEFYANTLSLLEGGCNKVVNHYRGQIKYYRSASFVPPAYFSKEVSLNTSDFAIFLDLAMEESHQTELMQKFEEYRVNDSARLKGELVDIHKLEINNLDGYFDND